MRIGNNPMKETSILSKDFVHRIIMPVYIPNAEGYFEKLFEVLKLSLESLLQTVHAGTAITLINNDCSAEVSSYLQELLRTKRIDQLVENSINKGKIDPVVSVMKGVLEPLITITDADVLFKNGWQQEVEKIFFTIPSVGMVSPLPQPAQFKYFCSWSWYFGFTRNCFTMKENSDLDAVKKFKESTTGFTEFSGIEERPLGISYNGVEAIIGAGHFCATYNRVILNNIPSQSSGVEFAGAEVLFLDKPVEETGMLRLATSKGWVYHMGNVAESWMYEVSASNKRDILHDNSKQLDKYSFNNKGLGYKPKIINKIIHSILNSTKFKNLVFAMAKK